MLTEESLPNIIKTIKKKRTNENYQEILNEYLKNNNSCLSTNRTNKINSSFFDNIMNNNLLKIAKLKNVFIKISQKEKLNILKSYFTKWQKEEKEKKEKIVLNNNNLNKKEINQEIIENNKFYISNINNDIREKETENEIKNNNIFKEIKNIENGANKYKQILEFDEKIFPPYEDSNNNSININNENGSNNLKENKKNIMDNNQLIEDDFDIKINEEMVINQKDNSKLKSDTFDSNEMNVSSIYLKDKSNILDNASNISQEKVKNISKNDIMETNTEICNISNNNTQRDSINCGNIKNADVKNDELKNEEIIEQKENELLSKIKERREKFKEEIRKTFNKNVIFDSLENITFINNLTSYGHKKQKEYLTKNNTLSNINQTKKKILSHFMTDNPVLDNEKDTLGMKPKKRFFYKISSTNNIFLKNKSEADIIETDDKNSFSNTNLIKIENIFIKGNNKNNNNKTKTENITKKKLQLFIIDKNGDIQINQKKDENKKENEKESDFLNGNKIIKNNLYERIIDSNMIKNFLNNTKNEPMFQKKNFQTIEGHNPHSKINLNVNNIINFSINNSNNPKIKTDENTHKTINYNSFNNNFVYERKNHFYLKKALNMVKINNNNINTNKNRSISNRINKKNNLKLNELELIEPNVQKCPVSLRQEKNCINEERKSNGTKKVLKDHLFYIKKEYNTNSLKRKKRQPKSLSTEIINGKFNEKKNMKKERYISSYTNLNSNKNNKTNFISEDLLNFIDCIKTNQENDKRKENNQNTKKDVYNFNGIKYKQINSYREKNMKQNKNSSLIVDSFKRIYNYKLNNNKNVRKETDRNNESIGKNSKVKNVDYKRLNELYLDYKIKDIRRNKLKNEQDSNQGITFAPHINKIRSKK